MLDKDGKRQLASAEGHRGYDNIGLEEHAENTVSNEADGDNSSKSLPEENDSVVVQRYNQVNKDITSGMMEGSCQRVVIAVGAKNDCDATNVVIVKDGDAHDLVGDDEVSSECGGINNPNFNISDEHEDLSDKGTVSSADTEIAGRENEEFQCNNHYFSNGNGKILNCTSEMEIPIPDDAVINYNAGRVRAKKKNSSKTQDSFSEEKIPIEQVEMNVAIIHDSSDKAQEAHTLYNETYAQNGGHLVDGEMKTISVGIPVPSPLTSEKLIPQANGKPFEEYFIPANTHKKFLRGEKLYLTKDKRTPCTSWKRVIMCGVVILIIAVAVLVGALAATGILLAERSSSQRSIPVEIYSSDMPQSASISGNAPSPTNTASHTSSTTRSNQSPTKQSVIMPLANTTAAPPSTVPHMPPVANEISETVPSLVPNAITGEFRIIDANVSDVVKDNSSLLYKRLTRSIELELRKILQEKRQNLTLLKVNSIRFPDIVVSFVAIWDTENGAISGDEVVSAIKAYLMENNSSLSSFPVDQDSVRARAVINECLRQNGGCSHNCSWSYSTLRTTCSCPSGKKLKDDQRTCTSDKSSEKGWQPSVSTSPFTTDIPSTNPPLELSSEGTTMMELATQEEVQHTSSQTLNISVTESEHMTTEDFINQPVTTIDDNSATSPEHFTKKTPKIEDQDALTSLSPLSNTLDSNDVSGNTTDGDFFTDFSDLNTTLQNAIPPTETARGFTNDQQIIIKTVNESTTTDDPSKFDIMTTTINYSSSENITDGKQEAMEVTTKEAMPIYTTPSFEPEGVTETTEPEKEATLSPRVLSTQEDNEMTSVIENNHPITDITTVSAEMSNTSAILPVTIPTNESPEGSKTTESTTFEITTLELGMTTTLEAETTSNESRSDFTSEAPTTVVPPEITVATPENIVTTETISLYNATEGTTPTVETTTHSPASTPIMKEHMITTTTESPDTTTRLDFATEDSVDRKNGFNESKNLVTNMQSSSESISDAFGLSENSTEAVTESISTMVTHYPTPGDEGNNTTTAKVNPDTVVKTIYSTTTTIPTTTYQNLETFSPAPTFTTDNVKVEDVETGTSMPVSSEFSTDPAMMPYDNQTADYMVTSMSPNGTFVESEITTIPPVTVITRSMNPEETVDPPVQTEKSMNGNNVDLVNMTDIPITTTMLSSSNTTSILQANETFINVYENSTETENPTTVILTTEGIKMAPAFTSVTTTEQTTIQFENEHPTTISSRDDNNSTTDSAVYNSTPEPLLTTMKSDEDTTLMTTAVPTTTVSINDSAGEKNASDGLNITISDEGHSPPPEELNVTVHDEGNITTLDGGNDTSSFDEGNTTTPSADIVSTMTTLPETSFTTESTTSFLNTTEATPGCSEDEFSCPEDTTCRPKTMICDGIDDCQNGYDESNCDESCGMNFRCANASCIMATARCDGIYDCEDGSDENVCMGPSECNKHEVLCKDASACIRPLDICNNVYNCADRGDEVGCVDRTTCESMGRFFCGEGLCIPSSLRCDGHEDCKSREDEANCTCEANSFQCLNGFCISETNRCDGKGDCSDNSDEMGCIQVDMQGAVQVYDSVNNTWALLCAQDWNMDEAHKICQELGFSGAAETNVMAVAPNVTSWALRTNYSIYNQTTSTLWTEQIIFSDSCKSLEVATVKCEMFDCGTKKHSLSRRRKRIVDGPSTQPAQWPSLAMVYNFQHSKGCHGVIISPLWLVSSAECIENISYNETEWYVRVNNDGTQEGSFGLYQKKPAHRPFIHPHSSKFRSLILRDYDIALIRLKSPLDLKSSYLDAICLPPDEVRGGITCFAGSFGSKQPRVPPEEEPALVTYLDLQILDRDQCNDQSHYNGSVNSRMLCTNSNGPRNLCDNDEGSPLMCLSPKEKWYLAGLLSYQRWCGAYYQQPGVFSNLFGMVDFVKRVTGQAFYDVPYDPELYTREEFPKTTKMTEMTTFETTTTFGYETTGTTVKSIKELEDLSVAHTNTTSETLDVETTQTRMQPDYHQDMSTVTIMPIIEGNATSPSDMLLMETTGPYKYPPESPVEDTSDNTPSLTVTQQIEDALHSTNPTEDTVATNDTSWLINTPTPSEDASVTESTTMLDPEMHNVTNQPTSTEFPDILTTSEPNIPTSETQNITESSEDQVVPPPQDVSDRDSVTDVTETSSDMVPPSHDTNLTSHVDNTVPSQNETLLRITDDTNTNNSQDLLTTSNILSTTPASMLRDSGSVAVTEFMTNIPTEETIYDNTTDGNVTGQNDSKLEMSPMMKEESADKTFNSELDLPIANYKLNKSEAEESLLYHSENLTTEGITTASEVESSSDRDKIKDEILVPTTTDPIHMEESADLKSEKLTENFDTTQITADSAFDSTMITPRMLDRLIKTVKLLSRDESSTEDSRNINSNEYTTYSMLNTEMAEPDTSSPLSNMEVENSSTPNACESGILCIIGGKKECLSGNYICNQEKDCDDGSDEQNCVRLLKNMSLVEVFSEEYGWLPVCADSWSEEWSNLTCMHFGYSYSMETMYEPIYNNSDLEGVNKFFHLRSPVVKEIDVQFQNNFDLQALNECKTENVVKVICKEYVCGEWDLVNETSNRDSSITGQWPSVGTLEMENNTTKSSCTASIMSPVWVITSLDCLSQSDPTLALPWVFSMSSGSIPIKKIIAHPGANPDKAISLHNFALARLEKPIDQMDFAAEPSCLPLNDTKLSDACYAVGWKTHIEVSKVPWENCDAAAHNNGSFNLPVICTDVINSSSEFSQCEDHPGQLLLCANNEDGRWELHGISAPGQHNCSHPNQPLLFSSIWEESYWIKSIIGETGLLTARNTFSG